jgi:hypothetical protein
MLAKAQGEAQGDAKVKIRKIAKEQKNELKEKEKELFII